MCRGCRVWLKRLIPLKRYGGFGGDTYGGYAATNNDNNAGGYHVSPAGNKGGGGGSQQEVSCVARAFSLPCVSVPTLGGSCCGCAIAGTTLRRAGPACGQCRCSARSFLFAPHQASVCAANAASDGRMACFVHWMAMRVRARSSGPLRGRATASRLFLVSGLCEATRRVLVTQRGDTWTVVAARGFRLACNKPRFFDGSPFT